MAQTASKFEQFRELLEGPGLSFIMEAHNGLSARVVEEAGFRGIWASGLSMSAAMGVRDNNEASWTQVLDVLEFISDATSIPILVDGDTGYGNYNNFARFVSKLCGRSIAAVCIEDKIFPKTNSFLGEGQPLADIDEFCGKIKAGKDAQTDGSFTIIARVEALIAGWGLDEALKRAEAYRTAGADGILIHSKQKTPDEILAFAQEWAGRAPLVIVPTTYYATPTDRFRQADISMVIWANHNMRAAIAAMRDISRRIYEEESLAGIEDEIPSVKDVFELTGNSDLAAEEARYLRSRRSDVRAIVLAASRGGALGELTAEKPKCMLDVRGKPLLRRLATTIQESGIRDVTVVRGYKKDAVDLPALDYADNDRFAETGEVGSLAMARDRLTGPVLFSYGDILFRRYILDLLLEVPGDVVLAVDGQWREKSAQGHRDFVTCSRPFTADPLEDEPASVLSVNSELTGKAVSGEWIGLAKLSEKGSAAAAAEIDAMKDAGTVDGASMPDLINRLIEKGVDVRALYIAGHWLDVNDAFDLAEARNFL